MPNRPEITARPSGPSATREERLRRKARERALTTLSELYPIQFEQLVIAQLAALRREASHG